MTCIVGIAQKGTVILGADSAGVSGMDLRIRRDAKVFTNGPFVMGCTSSFRMIQLLQYSLSVPMRHPAEDVMKFMTTTFVDAVRNCFKAGGFASRQNEAESGGVFLVGYAGRLFSIQSDYQVAECLEGYDACGCGEPYALGYLHATAGDTDARNRLIGTLKCAEYFSAGVCGPFVVLEGGAA